MPQGQQDNSLVVDSQEILKRAQRTLVESTDVKAGASKFSAKVDSAEGRRTADESYFMKSVSGRTMPAAGVQANGALSGLTEQFSEAASGSLRLLAEAASQGVGLMLDYDAATKESFGSGTANESSTPGNIMRAAGSVAVSGILTSAQVGMFAIDAGNEMAQFAFNGANYTADVLAAASTAAVRGVAGATEFVADTVAASGAAALRGLFGSVEVLADGTVAFAGATARGVAGATEGIIDGFAAGAAGFIRLGTSAPTAVANGLTDVAGAAARGAVGFGGDLVNIGGDILSAPFQWGGGLLDVFGADSLADNVRGVGDGVNKITDSVDGLATGLTDSVTDGASKVTEALHSANVWTVDRVTNAAYWGVDRTTDAGTWAVDKATDGIYAIQDKATDITTAAVDWTSDTTFAAVDKVTDAGTWVVDNGTDTAYAAFDAVTDVPGGILNLQDRGIEAIQDNLGDRK